MVQTGGDVVLALDIGTGGARAIAYDLEGLLIAQSEAAYTTYYDRPTWAEQEAEDWWRATISALHTIALQLNGTYRIRAIGLTGQSPSIVPCDREGQPLRRGLIYQDNRATREAQEWTLQCGGPEAIHRRTGHEPAAFYIGPKVLWVRRHEPEIFARTHLWMQPRDFVAWRLTGQAVTDWSHAGSTLLFEIAGRRWASDLFERLAIPQSLFPPALPPWTNLGEMLPAIARQVGLAPGIPVVLGGADSQCCTVGAGVLTSGELSDMAGTSTCLNAPVRAPLSDLRIANYCHIVPDWWCTELGLNASGAAFEWLATLLAPAGAGPIFAECEAAAAQSEPGAKDALFLPYMADGERFNPALRGCFWGLSLRHTRAEIARAVLEGVGYAIREHLVTMVEAGAPVREMHISGGGASVNLWNQIKADIAGIPVVAVAVDATSLGVAMLAGTATGLYPSLDTAVARCVKIRQRYEPDTTYADLYTDRYARFCTLARAITAPGLLSAEGGP